MFKSFSRIIRANRKLQSMISIIIPVLNEGKTLPGLLTYLNRVLSDLDGCEILVCDGGSSDNTVDAAKASGARVVQCRQRGRASQMHEGAGAASGEILYFLHADTIPPEDFHLAILKAVSNGADSGCFRLRFHPPHPLLDLYSWFTRFSSRFLRYGDQSLFVKKEVYEAAGGFCMQHRIMEDFEFAGRLMDRSRFKVLDSAVSTSARRYTANGRVRLQFLFGVLCMMYLTGVSQDVMIHFYKSNIR